MRISVNHIHPTVWKRADGMIAITFSSVVHIEIGFPIAHWLSRRHAADFFHAKGQFLDR
jgi:hypothetical protein